MYKVSIPVNCDKFHRAQDKQIILDELRAFGADRVMLNFETTLDGHVVLQDEAEYRQLIDRMREACAFFKAEGYEVGAWFWGLQFDGDMPFTVIRTLRGKDVKGHACPSDESFREDFARRLADVAGTGVDMILLNDDLRFGAWGGFGCLCENHLRMIAEELGEEIEESRLAELITGGAKSRYRDALLRANRLSLEGYARRMRRAVDEVNPNVRLGFCACMTSWDIDGDAFELARIFAGRTRPLLRLIGAPYWTACQGEESRLQAIVELERMEASWRTDADIELIAEGDVYPRPRLNCPAAYLEGFDTALRASGALDGILRISMDYVSNVGYESGYLKAYLKNKPAYDAIDRHFSGKRSVGVRVYESQRKVSEMQIPNALGGTADMEQVFYSPAARMLSSNAIPTVYEGEGVTGICFGENAYALGEESLGRGMILDALAARILTDRGFDVGIRDFGGSFRMKYQYQAEDENYIIAGNRIADKLRLDESAEPLAYAKTSFDGEALPFCYRYKNARGQRFLVFAACGKDCDMHLRQQINARIIADSAEWLSGSRLPAFCYGNPNLYIQCKEDGDSLAVGIWNFFEDEAIEPVLELGEEYESAEFLCGFGELTHTRVKLDDVPPYSFRAIILKK